MEQDSDHLLSIFSNEVWMFIFDTMASKRSFDDILNSINSSLYFRNLIKSNRPALLFPCVFKILAPDYEHVTEPDYEEAKIRCERRRRPPSPNNGEILIEVYRTKRIISKLRLVCKTWKTGVDDYYQKLPHHYAMNHDSDFYYTYRLKCFSNVSTVIRDWSQEYFSSDEHPKTNQFLNIFRQTNLSKFSPGTPFISRRVVIRKTYSDPEAFMFRRNQVMEPITYNVVNEILDRFGRNIWYVDIMICDQFPTRSEYYKIIRQWLILMPNLRVLNVTYVIPNKYLSKSELNQLQGEIIEKPLPVLKHLKYIKTDALPSPILNELLRQNSKPVSMLQVHKSKWQDEGDIFSASTPAFNLKELSVRLDRDDGLSILGDLGKNWKLEKFYLDYNLKIQVRDLSRVFGIPANWASTLTTLMISIPQTENMGKVGKQADDLSGLILFTPNVIRFKLILKSQTIIDFMLPMRDNLESFEVGFICKVATEQSEMNDLARSCFKQVIQFVGYEGRLIQSNIWQLFPKLQKVQVWDDYDKQIFNKTREVSRKEWSQSGIKYYPRLK